MDRAGADGSPIYAVARTQRMDLEFNLGATYMFDGLPTWKETINKPMPKSWRPSRTRPCATN